ncbi:MAG TPA: hypothetical protein VFY68_18240, partial [Nitrososphaeraceae archaeon]|nr:hypothetical protein [Nitrososphaeraceae archaeon]
IKEDEEKPWAGFEDGELNSDTAHAALVRQRSRVQIPAKAHSSDQKKDEYVFSSLSSGNISLPNTVRS